MSNNLTVIYFLTEDLNNHKERNEIEYLTRLGRVVLVSRGTARANIPGVRQVLLPSYSAIAMRAFAIWTKICYLLCRIANSASDIEFPSRNIYSGTKLIRSLINGVWRLKLVGWVNRLLPAYDTLYFFPFRVALALRPSTLR